MKPCNLLNEKEKRVLENASLKSLTHARIYSLEYKDGLKIFAFLRLTFEANIYLTITTGKFADNIVFLDELDFSNEMDKYTRQDGVDLKVSTLPDSERIVDQKLLNVECIQKPDEEYYWQFNFHFSETTLHIGALVDELRVSLTLLN